MIELLVVISIIALLIAILLPTLSTARSTSRLAGCLSNEKQIGVLFNIYANDYDGYIPPTGIVVGSWRYWYNFLDCHADGRPLDITLAIAFRCPEASPTTNWSTRGTYGMNQAMTGSGLSGYNAANVKPSTNTVSGYYQFFNTIVPSNLYLASDAAVSSAGNWDFYMPLAAADIPGALRHMQMQRINVAFADGSARTKKTLVNPTSRYSTPYALPWLNGRGFASAYPDVE